MLYWSRGAAGVDILCMILPRRKASFGFSGSRNGTKGLSVDGMSVVDRTTSLLSGCSFVAVFGHLFEGEILPQVVTSSQTMRLEAYHRL